MADGRNISYSRLLKKAHLRRWHAWALAAAYRKYASLGPARAALHLDLFEQLPMNGCPPPPDENGAIRPKTFALVALAGYFPSSLCESGFFSILLKAAVEGWRPG
jgi:hypothetical protein